MHRRRGPPIHSIAEIFEDPHYAARGTLSQPRLGRLTVPGVMPRLSDTPGRIDSLGPALGEGNRRIYGGLLGLSDEDLAALEAAGVI